MGPDVDALLTRVPGWAGRARAVGFLDGGITNRNVLVEVEGERFVLRLNGKDTALLEIRRTDELTAARRAAELGLAPPVHAFLEPEQYLVTRFVDGRALTGPEVAAPMVLAQVAFALRSFHRTPALAGDFDAFRVPSLHMAAAWSRGVAVPDAYDAAAGVSRRIAAAFAAFPDDPVPCHNDLLPANFLHGDEDRLWLLDWEYAGNNDRYFDLGNLAVNNEFDSETEAALVAAYFGTVTPRRLARLRLMKVMSDFREAMWGVVQQGISTLGVDYADYARVHFDRLLANAAAPGFSSLLDDAALPDDPPPGS